jgi:hypothetical protein
LNKKKKEVKSDNLDNKSDTMTDDIKTSISKAKAE